MKKILFLLLTAFAVASCNDDCDHFSDSGPGDFSIVGSWYEESQNEEDTYSATATMYGKFCNSITQGEASGNYFINSEGDRLTEDYRLSSGIQMTTNWRLRDMSELQFTMYSEKGTLVYGKIVGTHKMSEGETQGVTFKGQTILGYESTNENIATVSADGQIYATGEKGTAYIKLKLQSATIYEKVIVGDECADLWIDYSNLLDASYDEMVGILGAPDKSSQNGILKYTQYSYNTPIHSIISGIAIALSSVTQSINQVALNLRKGIPQETVMSYLDAHYYRQGKTSAGQYYFSTSSTMNRSRAVYVYDPETQLVSIFTTEYFEWGEGLAYWPNFASYCFGMTSSQLKAKMEKKGYTLIPNPDSGSHSLNGNLKYSYKGYPYTNIVEFAFNKDQVVSEFIVYNNYPADEELAQLIGLYLKDYYDVYGTEDVNGHLADMVYYNQEKTLKVAQKARSIIFTDLTKTATEWELDLGNYWKGLGMTNDELVSAFGANDGNQEQINALIYNVKDRFVEAVNFLMDNSTGTAKAINLFLTYDVPQEQVRSYLNSLYTYNETVTEDGSTKERWMNATSKDNATMMVTYYPDDAVIVYSYPKKQFSLAEYLNYFDKTRSTIQESITAKGGEYQLYGSQVYYTNPSETGIQGVLFSFSPITYKCNKITINLDMNSISEQEIADALKSEFDFVYGFEGIGYMLKTNDGKWQVFYAVSSAVIEITPQ